MNLPKEYGKYVIHDKIGNGQFGEVYYAHDRALDVDRAIKVIYTQQPAAAVAALKEAQLLEACRHKHIIDVKEADVWVVKNVPLACIAIEYMANGSVQGLLRQQFVSVRQACRLVTEALLGLEHAHSLGVLHRDIKPGNILLSDTNYAMLSDFGHAMNFRTGVPSFDGYIAHLAPEVVAGQVQDRQSDIYAMGVTLYRLINNLRELNNPFGPDQAALLTATQRGTFPDRKYLPHVPKRVVTIVNTAMHPDRGRRYENAQDFRQALERLLFDIDWVARGPYDWTGSDKNGRTHTVALVSGRARHDVVYRVNGRRRRKRCSQFQDERNAKAEILRLVNSTTLAEG